MKAFRMDGVFLVVLQTMQDDIKELAKELEEQRSDLIKLQQKVNELERKAKEKPTIVSRF